MKTALLYARHNVNLGRAYLRMNGYTRIEVGRHHLGDPGFQAWLMNGESTGSPTSYRLKRDAMADAKIVSEAFGLPIVNV